ncbi:MAG: hypothetical protein HY593_00805, partial [Candidatus Omnitrophica bacterium]|nr:hypothetical protein [Candidatus Omnitrophota bacterium]
TYTREDLAEKSILIDVLTGIISPLDDGDLVISMFALNKVAGLYGLNLSGANLTWEDLLALYESSPITRIIAHVRGNHYLVIQSVTEDSVTYTDPGAGPDKQNQIETLSKKDFLKGWKGNVSGDSVILNAAKQREGSQVRTLSTEETQTIRGAFFFFLIPAIIGALSSIGGAIASVIAGIGSIIGTIGSFVGTFLSGIGQVLGGFLQGIGYLGNALWQGISFAASSLWGALGNVGSFLSQNVFGSLLKASFGNSLFETAVKVGLNYATTRGLESLGVSPKIASLASAFVTGGTSAFFDPKNAFTVGSFFVQGVKGLALQGTNTLLQSAGLDSSISSILSIFSVPLGEDFFQGTIGDTFFKLAPQLGSQLGLYGVNKLATSLGLNTSLTNILTSSLGGMLNAQTQGKTIIEGIEQGLLSGITSVGIDYAVDKLDLDPLLGSLTTRALTGALSGALGGGDVFGGIYKAFTDSALNVARLGTSGTDSYSQTLYLQKVLTMSSLIQQKGLAQALETYATGILHQDSIESILASFKSVGAFIQNAIDQNKFKTVQVDNKFFKELEIKADSSLRFTDNLSDLVRIKQGSEIMEGSFGSVDSTFGEITGTYQNKLGDSFDSYEQFQRIENGQQAYAEIKDSKGSTVLVVSPRENGGYNAFNSFGNYADAVIRNPLADASYALKDSTILNERVNLNVFFGGDALDLNDYFEFDLEEGKVHFDLQSLKPTDSQGTPINVFQNKEFKNYISNFWLPSAFAAEDESRILDARSVFNNLYQDIISNPDYVHQRDQGNTQAIDWLWNKSKELSGGDTELALEHFSNIVNFRDIHFDASQDARDLRMANIPSALNGEWQLQYDNRDKLQHFSVSASLAYKYGRFAADRMGVYNEVLDEFKLMKTQYTDPKYHNNGGYSMGDINANRLGQNFGELLKENPNAKPSDILNNN